VENRKDQALASSTGQTGVAPDPAPTKGIALRAETRTPARGSSGEVATTSPLSAAPAPVVVARPGEITRTARPSGGYQVIPPYPATARQQRAEGTTLLRVLVLADGRVGDVAVQKSAGHADLDQAAAEAVRQWRFDPAREGADAVAMWVLLPVQFHLTPP
jgi:protein TonB